MEVRGETSRVRIKRRNAGVYRRKREAEGEGLYGTRCREAEHPPPSPDAHNLQAAAV